MVLGKKMAIGPKFGPQRWAENALNSITGLVV